jgi:hypothetical protein
VDWVSFRRALGRPRGPLGIRLGDVGMTAVVLVAVELSVATGSGPGAARLDATAYLLGAVLVLPVLLRNRYPRFACSALLLAYYSFDRRDISPAPLLSVPLYDAALAGFLLAAVVIPAVYIAMGLSNEEIAARLVVSPLTAKTHVSRAMTKLAARDRAQLVVFAYAHGLAAPSS